MQGRAIVCLVAVWAFSSPAAAVRVDADATAGLFQQPTSHYYHAIYGANFNISNSQETLIGRVGGFERPEFRAAGFSDKDYGWHVLAGAKVTRQKTHGLYAFIGGGAVAGYVRQTSESDGEPPATRSYHARSLSAAADYRIRLKGLSMAFGHQTYIGLVDQSQVEAYVAWPFNTYQVSLGYGW